MNIIEIGMEPKQGHLKPVLSVSVKSSACSAPSIDFKISSESISLPHSLEMLADASSSKLPVEESILTVPPTTPAAAFSFDHFYSRLPRPFPQDDLHLPYIREVGIKNCLDTLSVHFNCADYKLNLVKFWFLDVITDCLWKMQDEFQFPEPYQKIILRWILYFMDLIRDPQRNLSRKEFFRIFNEAMVISHEKVQAGCEFLPSPADLFGLVEDEEEEISFPSSFPSTEECSSVSLTEKSDEGSYLAVGIDENPQIFKMPKPLPKYCNQDDISEKISRSLTEEESTNEKESSLHSSQLESIEFYQPDPNTPDRFRSSSPSSSSSSFHSFSGEEDYIPPFQQERFIWKRDSLHMKKTCSDEILDIKKASTLSDFQKDESYQSSESHVNQTRREWSTYLENRKDYIQGMEKNILINSCALFAIKEFIYDYFYETFQFTIVKFALINNFSSITQNLNTNWFIPKVLKEELKKPKPKKEKKKKKKQKKAKKPRKKTKAKKDKRKKKTKKDKKKKGKKKGKKEKKKKLTKAEKDELARLKREQQRLEEQLRIAEENRRLLFPLKDATTDEFFKSIFENWVKPKEKKKGKGKKGKKNKKGKKKK